MPVNQEVKTSNFTTPIVLFIFRRCDTVLKIIDRVREVRPTKIYLLSDAGRTAEEKEQVAVARQVIEKSIDWDCTVIKRYAEENIGVLNNIGQGAKWVFSQEERAIFLEDDNLPELSFFRFCDEMLEKYENDNRVLWVCGTNYLTPNQQEGYPYSYFFSQHMLPCGWASWSNKFLNYYDGMLESLADENALREYRNSYSDKRLFEQQFASLKRTKKLINSNQRKASWDYQMVYSLRVNHMYGIVPVMNQIRNIGADAISEHGGTSLKMEMTSRFCERETYGISFPLSHPPYMFAPFERELGEYILEPFRYRCAHKIGKILKPVMGLDEADSLKEFLSKNKG